MHFRCLRCPLYAHFIRSIKKQNNISLNVWKSTACMLVSREWIEAIVKFFIRSLRYRSFQRTHSQVVYKILLSSRFLHLLASSLSLFIYVDLTPLIKGHLRFSCLSLLVCRFWMFGLRYDRGNYFLVRKARWPDDCSARLHLFEACLSLRKSSQQTGT